MINFKERSDLLNRALVEGVHVGATVGFEYARTAMVTSSDLLQSEEGLLTRFIPRLDSEAHPLLYKLLQHSGDLMETTIITAGIYWLISGINSNFLKDRIPQVHRLAISSVVACSVLTAFEISGNDGWDIPVGLLAPLAFSATSILSKRRFSSPKV